MKNLKTFGFYLSSLLLVASCVRGTSKRREFWCEDDADCHAEASCDQDLFVRLSQTGIASAPAGLNGCVPTGTCLDNKDCSNEKFCLNNTCTEAECASDDDCEPFFCEPTSKKCSTSCESDKQCASTASCVDEECRANTCAADSELEQVCSGYTCAGSACRTDCESDRHCGPGRECSRGSCKKSVGEPCNQPSECALNGCGDGKCSSVCADVKRECGTAGTVECGHCPEGLYCAVAKCVAKKDPGDTCGGDEQCREGRCINFVCSAPLGNGDRCNHNSDCASGVCAAELVGDGVFASEHYCSSPLAKGSACEEASDCESQVCCVFGPQCC